MTSSFPLGLAVQLPQIPCTPQLWFPPLVKVAKLKANRPDLAKIQPIRRLQSVSKQEAQY